MLRKPIILLISGKAGVGKTTLAESMQLYLKSLDTDSMIIPFAIGVKSTARFSFLWDGKKDNKGRKLLQDIGKTGRDYDDLIWAKLAYNVIENYFSTPFIFMDDWRFPNEGEYVKSKVFHDVFTVRVESPERETLRGTEFYNNESETSLPSAPADYQFVCYNDGDLDELYSKGKFIIDQIIKEKGEFGVNNE